MIDDIFQGSRTYMLEIFQSLIVDCPEYDFYFFLENGSFLRELSPVYSMPNVKIVEVQSVNPIKRLCYQLPKLQLKYNLDLLHVQYIMPVPSFSPCMVSMHDILFESHPQYFGSFFRLRSKILMRYTALMCNHIFTISEFSRREIKNRYKIADSKISLAPCAADLSRYFPGNDGLDFIKNRGLTTKAYILCVGRLEPRKNHINLLKAYANTSKEKPLVIVGKQHFGYQAIERLVHELNLTENVLFFHDVSDDELPALYRHALLFLYPTFAEGFGMPPLEAMASATPVITSNRTAVPEVAGDAAWLIDPEDVAGIAVAINTLLSSREERELRIVNGLKQAEIFSWSISASVLKGVYGRLFDE